MLCGVHAALLVSVCTLVPTPTSRTATTDAAADVRVDGAAPSVQTVNHGDRLPTSVTTSRKAQSSMPPSATLNLYAPVDGRLPPDEQQPEQMPQPEAQLATSNHVLGQRVRSLLSNYFKTAKLVAPPPLLFSDTLRGGMQL
mmetsp:Transcript_10480/g.27188  ORF Transcript_10480/g.27188 Transcript_10480/m.27188 type:complete len:141 (-) Transcript_10480:255-677(-)